MDRIQKLQRQPKITPLNLSGTAIHKDGESYNAVKHLIRPFDLIMFRGNDFVSNSIRKLQRKQLGKGAEAYSHCGMIITTEILSHPNMVPGKLYVWESTMGGKLGGGVKNINGETWLGSQVRDFDAVMASYDEPKDTQIAWGQLHDNPLDRMPLTEIRERMAYLFGKYNHKLYEVVIPNLFMGLFPRLRCFRAGNQKSQIFCSELVALIYKKFGVVSAGCKPADVVPADFVVQDQDGNVDFRKWQPLRLMTVTK